MRGLRILNGNPSLSATLEKSYPQPPFFWGAGYFPAKTGLKKPSKKAQTWAEKEGLRYMPTQFKYKKARFYSYVTKAGKREEYIEYFVWCIPLGSLYRRRLYKFCDSKNPQIRRREANKVVKTINGLLKKGYVLTRNPKDKNPEKQLLSYDAPQSDNVLDVLEWNLHRISKELSKKTVVSYTSPLVHFENFLRKTGMAEIKIHELSYSLFSNWIHWLKDKQDLSNKTVNNYVGFMRTMLNRLLADKYIVENPLANRRKLKENSQRNTPFSSRARKHLKVAISERDPYLWKFIHFIMYGLMRINETRLLKVDMIDFDENRIFIPQEISKVGDRYVALTKPLRKVCEELIPPSSNPNDYIFTKKHIPGSVPVGEKYFSTRHRKILDSLKYDIDRYVLYSWKATGVLMHVKAGFDIVWIQKQIGHASIETTNEYLKNIGHDYHINPDQDAPEV